MRVVQLARFLVIVSSATAGKLQEDSDGEDLIFPNPTPLPLSNVHVPWTLQSSRSRAEIKRWSGRLDYKRQDPSGNCLYPDPASGYPLFCTDGGICCSSPTKSICCATGTFCVGTETCCNIGTTPCATGLCCEAGATCCGDLICCASGTVCEGDICIDPQVSQQSVQSDQSIASAQIASSVSGVSVASVASASLASASVSQQASSHRASVVGGAVGGVIGGIVLIAAVAFLWMLLKKKKKAANVGSTGAPMASSNNQTFLFQGGTSNEENSPNIFEQPVGTQSNLGAGMYTGAAEVMPGRPTTLPLSAQNSPLPMRMERTRITADDRVASISSFPYVIPPSLDAHPSASSHMGGTSS